MSPSFRPGPRITGTGRGIRPAAARPSRGCRAADCQFQADSESPGQWLTQLRLAATAAYYDAVQPQA